VRAANVDTQYQLQPNTLNLILRIVFPLVLSLFFVQGKWGFRFSALFLTSLVLVVTAVFVIRIFSGPNTVPVIVLTSFIRGLIILFLFLTLLQIAQLGSFHPLTVVGVGWGTYVLAQGIGLYARLSLGLELDDGLALNIIYVLIVLSVLTLILANRRAFKGTLATPLDASVFGKVRAKDDLLSPEVEPAKAVQAAKELEAQKFAGMKANYRLTERELEVLVLICQGRSKRYIADFYSITENTVRGHVKSLHMKCGVHTKQELIDLTEGGSPVTGKTSF
jgi:DNA-binding CsgD family transcriptional regulator